MGPGGAGRAPPWTWGCRLPADLEPPLGTGSCVNTRVWGCKWWCKWGVFVSRSTMAANCERTFIAIKPDGVQRGLVGEIIKRFEQKGFRLVAMKFVHVSPRAAGSLLNAFVQLPR